MQPLVGDKAVLEFGGLNEFIGTPGQMPPSPVIITYNFFAVLERPCFFTVRHTCDC